MEPRTTKTKVLQDFPRQEGISHGITETYCPQSNGMAERLNLTIMDKFHCMLIDANLTPKLWPYAAHYAVLIYNNLPYSSLGNHKIPNDAYGESSDVAKLYVFGSICYALQPSKLLQKLEERLEKESFLGIDPAGYKVLEIQSKFSYVATTVKVFDRKFLSTEENQIHGPSREEEQTHSSSLDLRYLYGSLKKITYMIQPEGFHDESGKVCLLQKYVISPSTKETRSTPQWSPIRPQERFWNLKMKNSNLICTVSSSKV
jgi:hypothetical protein